MSAIIDPATRARKASEGLSYYLPSGKLEWRVRCPNPNCPSTYSDTPSVALSASPYCHTTTGRMIKESVFACCRHRNKCGYDVRPDGHALQAHLKEEGIDVKAPEWTPPPVVRQKKFAPLETAKLAGTALDNYGMDMFGVEWRRVVFAYRVISKGNSNIFQYADERQRVRLRKPTTYRMDKGRLTKKNSKGQAQTRTEKIDPDVIDWCMFGGHLVKPNSRIAVVESEDAALVMAAAFPKDGRVWCASGGDGLRKHRQWLQELSEFNVQVELFPDRDAIAAWTEDCQILRGHGIRCGVNPWWTLEDVKPYLPKLGAKADVRDWLDLRLS